MFIFSLEIAQSKQLQLGNPGSHSDITNKHYLISIWSVFWKIVEAEIN